MGLKWIQGSGLGLLLGFACLWPPRTSRAQRLSIRVEGVRDSVGSLHFGFYRTPEDWDARKSNFQRHARKRAPEAGVLVFTYDDVPPGRYALAAVDDENDSGGMDWGWVLPQEGFGFADYYHRGLSRPAYEDFDFELAADSGLEIVVRLRYLQ